MINLLIILLATICVAMGNLNNKQTGSQITPPSFCCACQPGTHGKPGTPGIPGRDGRDGRDGNQGPPGSIGPGGPPGLQGAKGETGVQGPRGQRGERGDWASGLMSFYKNWKECAWKDLNDDKDHGLIKPPSSCCACQPGTHGKPGTPGMPGRDGRDGRDGNQGTPGMIGPGGPPGPQGAKGETGVQGPRGQRGERGNGASGLMSFYKNWKECAWKDLSDNKDYGLIKDCVFNKNFSETSLHVYWTGALRITGCDNCCKRWYFTFNGAECAAPLPIDGIVYMDKSTSQNIHRVNNIEGHCNNIHKGKVRVGFWVGNCAGYGNADASTGWKSVSRIFIEEVPKPQA